MMGEKLTIVIDSREQTPWAFSADVRTVVSGLPAGDYSLAGFEDEIAIERKSFDDFLGSITRGRTRFEAELRKLRPYRFKAIFVEDAGWDDVLFQRYRAQVHPNAVFGTISALQVKYGLPVIFLPTPEIAAQMAERMLTLFAKYVRRDFERLVSASEREVETNAECSAAVE
ncbi:MAG TPA: ERCC4 domain-containing protein [Candidatus Sumerlaeota bacterium]|nr:ERCC4 domain-containing protein [Candidatus Sumerlaeota bacterium]